MWLGALRHSARLAGMRFLALSLSLFCFSASSAVTAQGGRAPFVVVETGSGFARLQQAVDAIGSGTGTVEIASGRYRDCAVQNGGSIVYRAVVPGGAVFSGGICEDK